MHICNCEHPIKIYNKYIHEWMYVKCGRCNTCRNARAKRWVDRLNHERMCHPFTMFIYLDYDNEHLPMFDLSYNPLTGEKFLSDSRYTFDFDNQRLCVSDESFDSSAGKKHHSATRCAFKDGLFDEYCIPFNELKFDEQSDIDYFDARLRHPLRIPHGSVRDLQLFLKKFNKYCHDKITQTYRNFRYFIVQEYGPTTHRPHYHGLMFIDNQKVADRFSEVLSHSWGLGHSDFQFVESTAASYVAQYLNCDTHLPSFYRHPKIRPFFLCSRKPPIGSLLESNEEILEVFNSASVERVCRASAQTSLSFVPLLPSLKDRLFPKCPRFGALSHPLRVALYGLCDACKGEFSEDFEAWKGYLMERCFPSYPLYSDWFDFSSFVRTADVYQHSEVARYLCVISDNFEHDRPLRELFRISKRVCAQADVFGVSLDKYVSQIELFYNNVELNKLKIMYNTQEQLLSDKRNSVDDLVHMYPIYRDNVSESLSLNLNISDVPDYQRMCSQHKEIAEKNTKTSKKNAYFESRLKNNDNKLYSIIKNFYYAKKRNEDAETLA